MSQREVAPQAQSLCVTAQLRQCQCSHQIHLRWFTSSTNRATIHRRISVRDTPFNVSASGDREQWAGRPNLAGCRSYDQIGCGAEHVPEEPLRPEIVPLPRARGRAGRRRPRTG